MKLEFLISLINMLVLRLLKCIELNVKIVEQIGIHTWYGGGEDFIQAGFTIHDICQSEAEEAFYDQVLCASQADKYYPQVYLPVADGKGFFVGFMSADKSVAFEIDGFQHASQMQYDKNRDKMIFERYGMKVIRYQFSKKQI